MEPYEIVSGPLTLWAAPVGTEFPTLDEVPGAPWVKLGASGARNYSDDGVTVTHGQSINKITPAGAVGAVKALRTDESMMVGVTLWDNTLEAYTIALGGVAPSTTAAGADTVGYKSLGMSRGETVKSYALLARGASAYGAGMLAQFEVPRCYQSGSPAPAFRKGVPAGLALTFEALEDLEAENESERFGRLLQQHQAALP